mmetsp:Transcript_11856/g.23518  ORF Transcript_11856/g.23518 Transcript_11856/m.23518 type:complete len:225 (+) Transcript_11856:135-809(+)
MALASCTISGVSVLLLVGPFFLSPPSPSPPPPPLPSKNVLSSSKNVLSPVSELCRKGFPWLRDKCRLSSLCLLSKITPDSAISRNAVRKATRSSPSSHRKEEVAAAEKPPLLLPLLLPFLLPLLLLLLLPPPVLLLLPTGFRLREIHARASSCSASSLDTASTTSAAGVGGEGGGEGERVRGVEDDAKAKADDVSSPPLPPPRHLHPRRRGEEEVATRRREWSW